MLDSGSCGPAFGADSKRLDTRGAVDPGDPVVGQAYAATLLEIQQRRGRHDDG